MTVDEALAAIRAAGPQITDEQLRAILEEVRSDGYAEGHGDGYEVRARDE